MLYKSTFTLPYLISALPWSRLALLADLAAPVIALLQASCLRVCLSQNKSLECKSNLEVLDHKSSTFSIT